MHFIKHFSVQLTILTLAIIGLQGCSMAEDSTHNLLREARDLESLGNFKAAEDTFKKIPILNDKKSSLLKLAVLMDMSKFYLRVEDYTKAIIVCEQALKVCDEVYGPTDQLRTSILFTNACAYEGLKDDDKAKSIYTSLFLSAQQLHQAKEMRSLLPLVKLGDIEFRKNNFEQAFKLYYKASTITLLPSPLYRILDYRLAICSIALGRTAGAERYFKDSLPPDFRSSAPPELFDRYGQLLRKNYRFGSMGLLVKQKADWESQRKEYLDWLYQHAKAPLRFNQLDKCTNKDFSDRIRDADKSRDYRRFLEISVNLEPIR